MEKRDLKILIACEYSGIVRDAFIQKGHDVISCDLLPTESPGAHYQGDIFDIINNGFDNDNGLFFEQADTAIALFLGEAKRNAYNHYQIKR